MTAGPDSGAPTQGSFFRRVDWAAFGAATLASFLVYFFTLAPSVTLEDSGELATAGCHWGVPHPPGYPIWTCLANLFARAFGWVTFRGQPTPAWSIALASAVAGALAAGCTAMLIARSGRDMLAGMRGDADAAASRRDDLTCWVGGVSASLLFAFSPVMWSQSTIVEVYALNAFFLMLVFLLSYRWLQRPSDRVLWGLAFAFGLGLTNYQVLLLALVPLIVLVLLRNAALFRDFLLLAIPFLATPLILMLGADAPHPDFQKRPPLTGDLLAPAATPVFLCGLALFGVALLAALAATRGRARPWWVERRLGPLLAALFGLAFLLLLAPHVLPLRAYVAGGLSAPRMEPGRYMGIATAALGVVAGCVLAGVQKRDTWRAPWVAGPLLFAAACGVALAVQACAIPAWTPPTLPPESAPLGWGIYVLALAALLAVLFLLAATVPTGLFYAVPIGVIEVTLFVLLRKGVLLGLTHPTTWWFWTPVALNFLVLLLAWLFLPNGRTVAVATLLAEAGLAFYLYMPIVSGYNPPMNWGYPRTWEGFKHAVLRGQYEKIAPTAIFSRTFLHQIGGYCTDLRTQFTLLIAPLGFLPFTVWRVRMAGRRCHALYLAVALFLLAGAFVCVGRVSTFDELVRADKLFLAPVGLLMLAGGAAIALQQFADLLRHIREPGDISERLTVGVMLLLAILGLVFLGAKGVSGALAAGVRAPATAGASGLAAAGVVFALGLVLALAFLLKRWLEERHDFACGLDAAARRWLLALAAGFLVMSVLLIDLANPQGDLQDAFIQKVKFISSHGLFAVLIGYGLIFGLYVVDVLAGWLAGRRTATDAAPAAANAARGGRLPGVLRLGALAVGFVLPLVPIYENYHDDELVRVFGAAEQNGHDFGWQFGNGALRGAAAIAEELTPDEEPLPNPSYPPAMGMGAIFFGGTDPGRFVPTYMIYSAHVRPDVYLITQNALADNTYMSVMRDLMGDDIYIPTQGDSQHAFQVYLDEVQSGKRPRNADLRIENGRMLVSGAFGVMEINGILCDAIFQRNRARHSFYVEESYAIPWMLPYLTPHGLILELNAAPLSIPAATVRDDLDFWDWYTRRLVRAPGFRRDVAAMKSFAKLRSAIGGLYAARHLLPEAERAFREARLLYPCSPEGNFRLVQEVLLVEGRYDDALDVLDAYTRADPNNARAAAFAAHIRRARGIEDHIRELMQRSSDTNRLDPETALEVGACYRDLGNPDAAARFVEPLAAMTNLQPDFLFQVGMVLSSIHKPLPAAAAMDAVCSQIARLPPEQLLDMARIYGEAKQPQRMLVPLTRYLQLRPTDWQAWLDVATIHALQKQPVPARAAVRRALELGGDEALRLLQDNPQLRALVTPAPAGAAAFPP